MPSSFLRTTWLAACLLVLAWPSEAAERVRVAWDPSPDSSVVGYTLHYGTRSAQYSVQLDVGNRTDFELLLAAGTYFLAVKAYSSNGLVSGFSNELTVSIGDPTKTLTQLPAPAGDVREWTRSDLNGDGHADILWRNKATGQLAAWLLDGAWLKTETGLSHNVPDLNWQIAGTGDFNGDKKADLLWRHRQYGFLVVWLMNGLNCVGAVSLSTPQVGDTAWKIVAVGDITGDGHADIVWQHDTGPVAVWRMKGTTNLAGSALAVQATPHDSRWRVVGSADLNGDRQMDLVWQHADGWIATWLMSAGNVYGVQSLDPHAEFDTSWKIVGNVDVNRDGKQDLLWQHTADGTVMIWFMDGLKRISTANVTGGSLGGASWTVVGPK
jgi:hypothetical protein